MELIHTTYTHLLTVSWKLIKLEKENNGFNTNNTRL